MNYHQLATNFSKIFHPFCECLGTFSRFPIRQGWFFYLFLKRSVFLLSLLTLQRNTRMTDLRSVRRHIWSSLLRCTVILVEVLSQLLNSSTPTLHNIKTTKYARKSTNAFMTHYMGIICFSFTWITTNWPRIFQKFFILFASALALFLVSPYAKDGFSIFFLSVAFFYYLFLHYNEIHGWQTCGLWDAIYGRLYYAAHRINRGICLNS